MGMYAVYFENHFNKYIELYIEESLNNSTSLIENIFSGYKITSDYKILHNNNISNTHDASYYKLYNKPLELINEITSLVFDHSALLDCVIKIIAVDTNNNHISSNSFKGYLNIYTYNEQITEICKLLQDVIDDKDTTNALNEYILIVSTDDDSNDNNEFNLIFENEYISLIISSFVVKYYLIKINNFELGKKILNNIDGNRLINFDVSFAINVGKINSNDNIKKNIQCEFSVKSRFFNYTYIKQLYSMLSKNKELILRPFDIKQCDLCKLYLAKK